MHRPDPLPARAAQLKVEGSGNETIKDHTASKVKDYTTNWHPCLNPKSIDLI